MALEVAVDRLATCGQPPERLRKGLETVRQLLSNIERSPSEAKFRQVKKTNPAVQSRLFDECFDFLVAVGFKDNGDVLNFSDEPDLSEALAYIESLLMSLGGPSESVGGASSSTAPAQVQAKAVTASDAKRTAAQIRADKAREEAKRAEASTQEQLAALRKQRAGQYVEQQDRALAQHLSGRDADAPFDPIAALNATRGAHSFVSCTHCGESLRYNSATQAQAVLCPCGTLLQPIHLRGKAFMPRGPGDLPVEPGEPVDNDGRRRQASRGPYITLQDQSGNVSRLPLHSALRAIREQEGRQQRGAQDETIQALPTRTFQGTSGTVGDHGGATSKDERHCQICLEDFEEGDQLRTLPCFHLFHAKCIDQWLKVESKCPTCRHQVG